MTDFTVAIDSFAVWAAQPIAGYYQSIASLQPTVELSIIVPLGRRAY